MCTSDSCSVHGGRTPRKAYSVQSMLDTVHEHSQTPCSENWNLIRRALEIVLQAAHTDDLVTREVFP